MGLSSVNYDKSATANSNSIILFTVANNSFASWLNEKLKERGWSQAELARRASVSRTAISDVISEKRNPGPELCEAIARALKLPPETVFRAAGLLPPVPAVDEDIERTAHLLRQLSPEDRDVVVSLIRTLLDRVSASPPGQDKTHTNKPSRSKRPARSALND